MFAYLIGVPVSGIDSTMLVVKLNSTGDSLGKGEPGGSGDNSTQLFPKRSSHILGNKRVLGLDFWERLTHIEASLSGKYMHSVIIDCKHYF